MSEEINLVEVLVTPLAEFIKEIGKGVSYAQKELDNAALESQKNIKENYKELAKVGYTPSWYTIPTVEAEMKMVMYYEEKKDGGKQVLFHPFNAKTSSYFKAEGTSILKFKIVATPPPIDLTIPKTP